MQGALIIDKCSQLSYCVKDGIARFFNNNIEYNHQNHLGGKYAPPFMNFPYIFDIGYLLKIDEFGSVQNLPNIDLDVIILSLEKSDYSVEGIREKYPNACILSSFKEYNPSGGHPSKKWNDKLINLCKKVDIPTNPYSKSDRFKEFENIINRKLEYLPNPIDVDYLVENFYVEDRPNTAVCYVAPTHLDRGQRETIQFCNMISDKYGVDVIFIPYNWPYDHKKRLTFADFIKYITNTSFCINLDTWYQIGQIGLTCASLGTIHIGGVSDSNLNIYNETATNDFYKLDVTFRHLFENHISRMEYIETAFNRVYERHSLESVKKQIHKLIK